MSLLVGGTGITNIMLVSATERTRKFGLQLAVGALKREVPMQLLIKAVVLSMLGGVVGIVIAKAASCRHAVVMSVPFVFNPVIDTPSPLPSDAHSGSSLAFFTKPAYLAISDRNMACACSVLLIWMVLPCLTMVSFTAGSLKVATTASWMRLTLAGLRPLGPMRANQASTT